MKSSHISTHIHLNSQPYGRLTWLQMTPLVKYRQNQKQYSLTLRVHMSRIKYCLKDYIWDTHIRVFNSMNVWQYALYTQHHSMLDNPYNDTFCFWNHAMDSLFCFRFCSFWRYLTSELIFHLSQSSIKPPVDGISAYDCYLRKSQYFPFNVERYKTEPLVPFLTSLVWCSPWLGVESGTARTRSQHSTTSLSSLVEEGLNEQKAGVFEYSLHRLLDSLVV